MFYATSRSNLCNSKNYSISVGSYFTTSKAKWDVNIGYSTSGYLNFSSSIRDTNYRSQVDKTSYAFFISVLESYSSCPPTFTITIETGISFALKISFNEDYRSSITPAISRTST